MTNHDVVTGRPTDVVAGILVDANRRVLLAQRPMGKQLAGFWEFPGGKVEPGETHHQALVRELDEELGIRVDAIAPDTLIDVPRVGPAMNLILHAYMVNSWQGEPRQLEHAALIWCDPHRTRTGRLAPADRRILKAVCDLWRIDA